MTAAPLIPAGFQGKAPLRAEMEEPFPLPPDVPLSDGEQVVLPGMTDEESSRVTPRKAPMPPPNKESLYAPSENLTSQSVTSNNPKDVAARGKCPLWLVPPVAEHVEARALEYGALRYGPWNWRTQEIALSTYLSATLRHLSAYRDGEDVDADSGLIHLAHARATLGIILDAQAHGTLIDDRPGK